MSLDVDLILRTKNSLSNSPTFLETVNRAMEIIPAKNVFMVDAYSQNGTHRAVRFFKNAHILLKNGNRAVATQYGIEQSSSDWLMFLDDDVLIPNDWFHVAKQYMAIPEVGMIWGHPIIINPRSRNRMKVIMWLRRATEYNLHCRNFQHRGGLHDTLIRREAIEDIKIPPDLHVFEDWWIKKTVEDNGFLAISPPDLWCYHWLSVEYNRSTCAELGRLASAHPDQF